jgi:hypothetical protein
MSVPRQVYAREAPPRAIPIDQRVRLPPQVIGHILRGDSGGFKSALVGISLQSSYSVLISGSCQVLLSAVVHWVAANAVLLPIRRAQACPRHSFVFQINPKEKQT